LQKRVKRFKGDVKTAFAQNEDDPVLMYSKEQKEIPIKKVRVINDTKSLIEIRPDTYVESGNNYAIGIYEDGETKKRTHKTVSFWEATQAVLQHKPIIPTELDGRRLLFSLRQRDTVILYRTHSEEIDWNNPKYLRENVYRVRKFDVNGNIYFDYLYVADAKGSGDGNRLFFSARPNTLKVVPVAVDILGNMRRE
jgi:hypothetical protein